LVIHNLFLLGLAARPVYAPWPAFAGHDRRSRFESLEWTPLSIKIAGFQSGANPLAASWYSYLASHKGAGKGSIITYLLFHLKRVPAFKQYW